MFTTIRVRPCRTVCSASALAPTTMSQASSTSACCVSMRTWLSNASRGGEAHERQHRAAFLREAHEVEHRRALAFQMRGHADQRADRHDARAADARDRMSYGALSSASVGIGNASTRAASASGSKAAPAAFLSLPPSTVTKLGQKPFTHE